MIRLGNTLILGDSYSTFKGYIPEGSICYYSPEDPEHSGVTRVEQTWWHQLLAATDSVLLQNNSFSGSTIGFTGYNGDDFKNISFIRRFETLYEQGYFEENRVDTLLVFGGTNDDWSGAPEGQLMHEGWTEQDLYCALPAIGYLFHRVRELLPDTRVCTIINTGMKPCIHYALIESSQRNGAEVILMNHIDKISGHPTAVGMTQIKDQILACLQAE